MCLGWDDAPDGGDGRQGAQRHGAVGDCAGNSQQCGVERAIELCLDGAVNKRELKNGRTATFVGGDEGDEALIELSFNIYNIIWRASWQQTGK